MVHFSAGAHLGLYDTFLISVVPHEGKGSGLDQGGVYENEGKSVLLVEQINDILSTTRSAILPRDLQYRLNDLKVDYHKLLTHELNSARLQSRVTWASVGDANTKIFHDVATARKNQNAIWRLKDDFGTGFLMIKA